jgi:rhodanese-related sulfurtransferase
MVLKKEEVLAKMNDANVVVLNVLPKSAFQKLHIKGSQNMPLTEDHKGFAVEVQKSYGKDKYFITCGDHFGLLESYEAASALAEHGLTAENYSGGVQDWFKAGYPSEGSEVVLTAAAASANPPNFK